MESASFRLGIIAVIRLFFRKGPAREARDVDKAVEHYVVRVQGFIIEKKKE